MNSRIADRGMMTHMTEIEPLTRLMLDLKKRELGIQPNEPITIERLDECNKAIAKIMQCRTKGLWK